MVKNCDILTALTKLKLNPNLHFNTAMTRVTTVANPIAPITKLCDNRNIETPDISRISCSINALKKISNKLYYLAIILLAGGLRISEALNIKHSDISPLGFVKISGLKGSNEKIIQAGIATEFFIKCKSIPINPFQEYNRFFVYREFKKIGLSLHINKNTKASVTHIFRHLAAQESKKIGANQETIKRQLGHKQIKSTGFYA